jgi:hypothetical protein
MTTFEKASKHLLFCIMRMVTEQQTEHGAFRFVYHRTLNEIKDKLLETTEGDMKYVIIFATMFGDTASPATSMKLFAGAVDALIQNPGAELSILCQPRDYTELPEVVNIIVK